MRPFIIAPSILSADFARLGEEVTQVLAAGADMIHFDVMDHHFVPNLTVGPMVCRALKDYGIQAPIDVHLMVKPVEPLVKAFIAAGAYAICFHPEATAHTHRGLSMIKDAGLRAGLALNPATSPHCLDYVAELIDFVLVMSVNPGFGGQQFIPQTLTKLQQIHAWIMRQNRDIRLVVDGGVNVENIEEIARTGADSFVMGSAIFGQPEYKTTLAQIREKLAKVAN